MPATRIFTIADIFGDPHYRARGSIVRAPDEDLGGVAMAVVVPRLSETPGARRATPATTSAATRAASSREILGLPAEQIDTLQAQGVIGCANPRAEAKAATAP